jgi:hypothetical protein
VGLGLWVHDRGGCDEAGLMKDAYRAYSSSVPCTMHTRAPEFKHALLQMLALKLWHAISHAEHVTGSRPTPTIAKELFANTVRWRASWSCSSVAVLAGIHVMAHTCDG